MPEEPVEPQETVIDQIIEQHEEVATEQEADHPEVESSQESTKQVPLSALQKERKKRQEIELELQWMKQREAQQYAPPPAPVEEDNSRYESATREDLLRAQEESLRLFEERQWIRSNPEKYEKVNEYLPKFLKQRPHLASAIKDAPNRYEEAYVLMEALTPKQQQQLKAPPTPKKDAPGSPTGVPKSAAMNQAVDVMSMSDSEFQAWRDSKKRRR